MIMEFYKCRKTLVVYIFLGCKSNYDPGVDFENEQLFESRKKYWEEPDEYYFIYSILNSTRSVVEDYTLKVTRKNDAFTMQKEEVVQIDGQREKFFH